MLKFLIEAFKASKGRMPNNMEMILLKQKAAKQSVDERKVVSMFDRSAVNPNKPILGGKNIPETEDEIRRRLMDQNKKGIASMKKKLEDPEERAMGGRIGYKSGTDFLEDELNKLRTQKGVEEDPLTSTSINSFSSIPDLNNPDVLNQIAIDTGMPMQKEGLYGFRKDVATPETTSIIKDIQNYKRNPDPDMRFTAPEISDFMGVDGIFKGLNPEQVQSIYDKVEKDNDEYDFSDIQGQTAFLDPFTVVGGLIKIGKGAKASVLAKEFLKNKAKQKVGKTIFDKVQKKITPPKYPQGPSNIKTGGGGGRDIGGNRNVGGGNTARNSKGQTASQATKAGTGTSQGYSQHYATGGRIGYKFGTGKKSVEGLIDLIRNKFGKKSITTADKAPIPPKTLERKMFKKADENFKNKRMLDDDEYQDFLDEVGGADQLEAYDFDGTVGDAKRILKEQKQYMDDMELEYKKGNLDPKPGEKGRKEFLQKKLDEVEASGDQRLMTPDEIEELSSLDSDSQMDVVKTLAPKMVERLQLKQKYPGITDDLLDKILIDDNVQRKTEVLATIDEAFKMMEKGKGTDEILDTMKNVTRTKQADGGITRIGLKGGSGFLKFLKKFKVKQSGDDVKEFLSKRQFMKDIVGNTEKAKKARELREIKKNVDNYMKQYKGYQFPSDEQIKIDLEKKIQPILNKGRKLNADGGRIGYKFGLGPLFNFLNKKSPAKAYTDYLKSVKDRVKAGKEAEVAGEVIPIAAGGALITNQLKKKLKAMNEEQKKKIKQEMEKKADGGRIGYKVGSVDKMRRLILKAFGAGTAGMQQLSLVYFLG